MGIESCVYFGYFSINLIMEKKEDKKSYQVMIEEAIRADASRTGTSKQIIVKYLVENFSVDAEKSKHYIKGALKKGLETGHFKMAKESGKGANSYKLGEVATKAKKPESAKAPKKKSVKSPAQKAGDVVRKKAAPKATTKKKTATEPSTTPKKAKTAVSKVKEASKPKKTPTKKIGKAAAAAPAKAKK